MEEKDSLAKESSEITYSMLNPFIPEEGDNSVPTPEPFITEESNSVSIPETLITKEGNNNVMIEPQLDIDEQTVVNKKKEIGKQLQKNFKCTFG